MAKKKNSAARSKNPAKRAAAAKPTTGNGTARVERARTPRTSFGRWFSAARPQTLGLAIAPVAFGTGVASANQAVNYLYAALALVVALGLQIGVNYANDYSDGIRGTDAVRVGPFRLTASGFVKAKSVRNAAFIAFGIAAATGLGLVVLSKLWIFIALGALAIVAAWLYTGGKRPYGYAGYGELIAFFFFGPVAVYGTTWSQNPLTFSGQWIAFAALGGALGLGFFAAAVLLVNNLRDIETDAAVGKRTLAVLLGVIPTKILFTLLVLAAYGVAVPYLLFYPVTELAFFTLLIMLPVLAIVWSYRSPRELVTALKLTTASATLYGLLLAWGMIYGKLL